VSEAQNQELTAASMKQKLPVRWAATFYAAFTLALAMRAVASPNPERNVYFGEEHVHTSWSFDAFAFGDTVTGPEEFYQYALGQLTLHPGGFKQTITKPLDWAADTEHAEYDCRARPNSAFTSKGQWQFKNHPC
jgi:hypothetical protein